MNLLSERRSCGKLGEPAPSGEVLERILRVALRAPDHGALRPWSILLIEGEGRARLGDLMADSLRRRKPEVAEDELTRERGKPLRAPMVVVVAAKIKESPKAPEIEQLLSAGAVTYGFQIAAQAEGFGSIWRTGDAAYDPEVVRGLGLGENERIVAFLYVGTPTIQPPDASRPGPDALVRRWP